MAPQAEFRTANARRLRREWTKAEARLWLHLRSRRLDGFKFRRQVPIERYFADFARLEAKLVIELDGGGHSEQLAYDAARTACWRTAATTCSGSGTITC